MDKLSPNRPKDPVPGPVQPESAATDKMVLSPPCFKALCGCPLLASPNPSTVSWPVWTSPPPLLDHPSVYLGHPSTSCAPKLHQLSLQYSDITSSRKVSCLDASRPVGAAHGLPRLRVLPPPHGLVTQLSLPFLRGSAGLAAGAWGWGPGRGGRKCGEHGRCAHVA